MHLAMELIKDKTTNLDTINPLLNRDTIKPPPYTNIRVVDLSRFSAPEFPAANNGGDRYHNG
jgi:hypothetical protein